MKSAEIRQLFLNYFEEKGHHIVPSSSLVPSNDPTLLFTNAGMVQFKDCFLGLEKRPYTRATSSQRCLRAGGKHNDLENVGYTARHHTFFEMLGNFSFGDYFKKEAIQFAWEFLTEVIKLPAEKLWVTVYEDDDEAADIWLKEMGVSAERFSRCGEKDNFWSMGDTGPCGPCTEIFYDHGPDIAGGPPGSPDEDGDRYIEIWNLVFMQYNRDASGKLEPLPKPSVDTGMGLERVAAVVQGVHNNYHIDSFQHLIKALHQQCPTVDIEHPSLKVIADHIRACCFLICDGVMPGNEGRGYVLRRIIRRAVRHGNKLGLPSPFFSSLVKPLIEVMGEAYPELHQQQQQMVHLLDLEEQQFNRTLEQGLRLLNEEISQLKQPLLTGEVTFKLYDTYGFPVDLTADIAREHSIEVDMAGFERCMEKQRQQSQSASQFQADYLERMNIEHESEFHGYEKEDLHSNVIGLFKEGCAVEELKAGDSGAVILDHTPFYAESGGQVGDSGLLMADGLRFEVTDTKKSAQAIIHYGQLKEGQLKLNQEIYAEIDSQRRQAIRLNHTATHLLHAALKQVLGDHVQQKGSLVDAERARFDFTHFQPMTAEEVRKVEALVNEQIRNNERVATEVMDFEEAKNSGAVALFGEKYADKVRVLTMGDFSKELCGGTHAARTGDLGLFKIASEAGIASGVRRIEMLTGFYALQWIWQQQDMLENASGLLKTSPAKLADKVEQVMVDLKAVEKEQQKLKQKLAQQSSQDISAEIERIGDADVLIRQMDGMDMKALRELQDQLKAKLTSGLWVLYAVNDDKLAVISGMSKSLIGKAPTAVKLVQILCGKGGGRDDMAQGGGPAPADLSARVDEARALIKAELI